MDTVTYTKRSNARRAALRTGLRADQIAITVHKLSGEVRFGWCQIELPAITTEIDCLPSCMALDSVGAGGKRPSPGTKCSLIWDWLAEHPAATLGEAKVAGNKFGWNINTLTRQFYLQRRCGSFKKQ